jgi:hypothetical protein
MTAPAFPLETTLGWFSLTVVDERHIVARAPAGAGTLLMLDGEQLRVQVELCPDVDGVWRPRERDDLLVVRRGQGRIRVESEQDRRLHQMIIDVLGEAVTAWASDCPILLATAAAFHRDPARHCPHPEG